MKQDGKAIANEAAEIAAYYIDAGILSYGAGFISIDKYGLDAGAENGAAADPASSTWFWNVDHWNNYLLFAKTLHNATDLPVTLWQIPVGHINSSTAVNPYDVDGTFDDLTNTNRNYEDSAPTFFLGDTFIADGLRHDYFASNDGGDSGVSVSGSEITWEAHMEAARDAGVTAIYFGAGVGDSTDGVGSPPTDDYWWISQVQEYYANPVPLDGAPDPHPDPDPDPEPEPEPLATLSIEDAVITEGDSASAAVDVYVRAFTCGRRNRDRAIQHPRRLGPGRQRLPSCTGGR